MIDRYIDRPSVTFSSGTYAILDSFCFAEFLRHYYLASGQSKGNNYQPNIFQDDLIEHNHVSENNYPKQIPLISSNAKLKCRKVPYVLKYHLPNKHTQTHTNTHTHTHTHTYIYI